MNASRLSLPVSQRMQDSQTNNKLTTAHNLLIKSSSESKLQSTKTKEKPSAKKLNKHATYVFLQMGLSLSRKRRRSYVRPSSSPTLCLTSGLSTGRPIYSIYSRRAGAHRNALRRSSSAPHTLESLMFCRLDFERGSKKKRRAHIMIPARAFCMRVVKPHAGFHGLALSALAKFMWFNYCLRGNFE